MEKYSYENVLHHEAVNLSTQRAFGLDNNLVTEEKVPLIVEIPRNIRLTRFYD